MTHKKFGVQMSRHCRGKDLIVILAVCLNFAAVVYKKIILSIVTKSITFSLHSLEMI